MSDESTSVSRRYTPPSFYRSVQLEGGVGHIIVDQSGFIPSRSSLELLISSAQNTLAMSDDEVGESNAYFCANHFPEMLEQVTPQKYLTEDLKVTSRAVISARNLRYRSSSKSQKPTFIYLMENSRNGLIKIGYSTNPTKREKTLQSEEPEVSMIFKTIGSISTEVILHAKYASKRIRGEWFRLTKKDIEEIKRILK